MAETFTKSLAGIELLEEINPERRTGLERIARWRRCRAKELVFDMQSSGTEVYFIVEGALQVVNYSPAGREVSFAQVPAGGYIGEMSAIDSKTRSATVVAAEGTVLASITAKVFKDLLLDYPKISLVVLQNLAAMVRAADERIMDLSTLSAINRVHAELLRLAVIDDDDDNMAIITPILTHSDIAARASTTRETVSRVLSNLARIRVLEREQKALKVLDVDRLSNMIEASE
jgi:CRP-like cAMP-binding protein